MSDKVYDENVVYLPMDFTISDNENKYISILKVRLINSNGQMDIGCCLCGNFADESSYSYGLMDDFIMCSNEFNEKSIHIHNENIRSLKFWFKDYKGVLIQDSDNYYYTLELKLIY